MRMVTAILEKEGYRVVPACDGREAYRIRHADADFEAAIFDMNMPHLKGLEVLSHMQTEKRLMRIPVMMITAERDLKLYFTGSFSKSESFTQNALTFSPRLKRS